MNFKAERNWKMNNTYNTHCQFTKRRYKTHSVSYWMVTNFASGAVTLGIPETKNTHTHTHTHTQRKKPATSSRL